MPIKFTFKSKIVVNGKQYDSVEDLPEDVRKAVDAAITDASGVPSTGSRAKKIMIDGNEYSSLDELPADARKLHDLAVAALDAQKSHLGTKEASLMNQARNQPWTPPSGSRRVIVRGLLGSVFILLLIALMWVLSGPSTRF